MKATARFVISNSSASAIGIDMRELYEIDIKSTEESAERGQIAIVKILNTNKFAPFMLEIADITFEPHALVVRAWFVYDFEDQPNSRLFQGALEIRAIQS